MHSNGAIFGEGAVCLSSFFPSKVETPYPSHKVPPPCLPLPPPPLRPSAPMADAMKACRGESPVGGKEEEEEPGGMGGGRGV